MNDTCCFGTAAAFVAQRCNKFQKLMCWLNYYGNVPATCQRGIASLLTLYVLMYSSFRFDTINLGYLGCQVIIFQKYCILLSEYPFSFTNSVDPDEIQHYAAFHLGRHCLQKYLFRGFPNTNG